MQGRKALAIGQVGTDFLIQQKQQKRQGRLLAPANRRADHEANRIAARRAGERGVGVAAAPDDLAHQALVLQKQSLVEGASPAWVPGIWLEAVGKQGVENSDSLRFLRVGLHAYYLPQGAGVGLLAPIERDGCIGVGPGPQRPVYRRKVRVGKGIVECADSGRIRRKCQARRVGRRKQRGLCWCGWRLPRRPPCRGSQACGEKGDCRRRAR